MILHSIPDQPNLLQYCEHNELLDHAFEAGTNSVEKTHDKPCPIKFKKFYKGSPFDLRSPEPAANCEHKAVLRPALEAGTNSVEETHDK